MLLSNIIKIHSYIPPTCVDMSRVTSVKLFGETRSYLSGEYRSREEKNGAIDGREQATRETEKRTTNWFQETTEAHRHTETTKGT